MTTTCIPQPSIITTCSTESSSRLGGVAAVRTAVASLFRRFGGAAGTLEWPAGRSTPSEAALESIESFPGLRR